ncbi:MAG: DDE-type integrase/transposase/recombinase [Candidatus Omnitrophica bacterium]|nr:DDE-type integrase/transposase/recombinase [Candidatus Omnitrophota bacterium]
MNEKRLRENAIKRYENGESPKAIYQSLGKSEAWFFKWLKRYQHDGENWAESKSREPHHTPNKINKTMEQAVIDTRKSLEKELYAQIGAFSISWQLSRQGVIPPPISTINKILKRNNLVRKGAKYQPKGVTYPAPKVNTSNDLHQFDIVGPRYLKTDGRFYSANIIDAHDRRCNINPMRRKNRTDIIAALVRCWHTLGLPVYLQMDNMLPTRGSNRYPHSFGLVIRLCLKLGIQPVFVPIREPWRNAIIEHFQNVFDKKFFRVQYFKNFSHLLKQAKGFETFHNRNYRYSTLGAKTPVEKCSNNVKLLPEGFTIPEKLIITPGLVHAIRFIRSNLILDVFGEKLAVPRDVEYEYVWATIDTTQEKLFVKHDGKTVAEFKYPLPATSIDMSKNEL